MIGRSGPIDLRWTTVDFGPKRFEEYKSFFKHFSFYFYLICIFKQSHYLVSLLQLTNSGAGRGQGGGEKSHNILRLARKRLFNDWADLINSYISHGVNELVR